MLINLLKLLLIRKIFCNQISDYKNFILILLLIQRIDMFILFPNV